MVAPNLVPVPILQRGHLKESPPRYQLHAGALQLTFEAGQLRWIRYGQIELWRGLYAAVRDANWGTVEPRLENLHIEASDNSFRVTFEAICQQKSIDFRWQGTVEGHNNQITFGFEGESFSDFETNRVGFCLLHPMEAAGKSCRIEHESGAIEQSTFPLHIAPHQPWTDIRAMTHEAAANLWCEARFEGDVWETEDQRNWTDASFKTYCTPLRLPFPQRMKRGERVVQTVTLTLRDGEVDERHEASQDVVSICVEPQSTLKLPTLGLSWPADAELLNDNQCEHLRALRLSHLRINWVASQTPAKYFEYALHEAAKLSCPLEIALFFAQEAELHELVHCLQGFQAGGKNLHIGRWLIFDSQSKLSPTDLLEASRRLLTPFDETAQFVGGTDANFAELNRNRPATEHLDALTFSINPQVHAFDDASLVETLSAQAVVLQSAHKFANRLPVNVSQVTLKPRFNAVATQEETLSGDDLPLQVDPRQMSLLGAAWTLGSIKNLALGGAQSATLYETIGWRGVMESAAGSLLPDKFPSWPNAVFPLYLVLAIIARSRDDKVLCTVSTAPCRVEALAFQNQQGMEVLLANFENRKQRVRIREMQTRVQCRYLDERNVEAAMREPQSWLLDAGEILVSRDGELEIEMFPFALAWITSGQ